MARPLKIISLVAVIGALAACDDNTNLENAGIGAAAGAGVAAVTGTNVAAGAAIGAGAGAVTNSIKDAVN